MFISHCPHCHEGFRIPAGEIPEDAYARCPWCHETFPVSEVWDRLPPTLEIIRADGTPLVSAEAATSIVGSGLKLVESRGPQPPSGFGAQDLTDWAEDDSVNDLANAEIMDEDPHATLADESVHQTIVDEDWHERMAGVASRDVELHSDEDPDETWDTAETTSSIQSMNVSTKGNARTKRKGSGIGTFIGIVLGGLLSLPIAGGILMLLGRTPDWGFWPFDGQQASSSIRAAAPLSERSNAADSRAPSGTTLRFNREPSQINDTTDPAEAAAREILGPSTPDSVGGNLVNQSELLDDASTPDMRIGDSDTSAVASSEIEDPSATETDAGATRLDATAVASSRPESSDPSALLARDSGAEPQTSPSSLPASRAEELATRATQMIGVLVSNQVDEAEQRRRLARTYQTIATATGLSSEAGDPLKTLAASIVASPLVDDFRLAGWQWLSTPDRASDGIALIGMTSPSDDGQTLTSDSGRAIPLVGNVEIPTAQEVLVLGKLDPQGTSIEVLHAEPIP